MANTMIINGMKVTCKELTATFIKMVFEANGYTKANFTCPDGMIATVVPCDDYNGKYYLIYWDMPWGGERTIEALARTLNRHAELRAEMADEEAKLFAFFEKHEKEGWDEHSEEFYSDWYKDVYGIRPRW